MRRFFTAALTCVLCLTYGLLPVSAALKTVYNSFDDFPLERGESGFVYEFSEDGAAFADMSSNGTNTWFVNPGNWDTSWAQKNQISLKTGPWVALSFLAPYSGSVTLADHTSLNTSQPLLYKSMHNERVLTEKSIDQLGDSFNVTNETIQVKKGDCIRVVFKNNGTADTTVWYQLKVAYEQIDTTLRFDADAFSLKEGQTKKLPFTAMTADGETNEPPPDVTWVSSDGTTVAAANGSVTGIKPGTAVITALSGSGTVLDTIEVTVELPPTDVEITQPPAFSLSGSALSVSLSLEKNDDTLGDDSARIAMIVVLRDENGYADQCVSAEGTVVKGQGPIKLTAENLEIPEHYRGTAQVFLWDSIEGMTPLYQRMLEGSTFDIGT